MTGILKFIYAKFMFCRSEKQLSEAYQAKEKELTGVKSNLAQMEDSIKELGMFMNRWTDKAPEDQINLATKTPADIVQSSLKELDAVFSAAHNFQSQDMKQGLKRDAGPDSGGLPTHEETIWPKRQRMAASSFTSTMSQDSSSSTGCLMIGPDSWTTLVTENTNLRSDNELLKSQKAEIEKMFSVCKGIANTS